MEATLPEGFQVRPAVMDDLKTVSELLKSCDIEEYGSPDFTEEDLRTDWMAPRFNLQTDSWFVTSPDGRLAGYADAGHRDHIRIYFLLRAHPDFRGLGIEQYLLDQIEAWATPHIALAQPDARITINSWFSEKNKGGGQLLMGNGYSLVRRYWRMEIEMVAPPPLPELVEGLTIRTMVQGQDERTIFEMIDEAFSDHWGHLPGVFEEWKHWNIEKESFDPTLYFLAFDGDQLAGGALCANYMEDLGWVDQLAVRRPWRRKGLGMALLHHAFGEFYRRGKNRVGLGVDSQNLTGAVRLYERVGMHAARTMESFQKELRAGIELSTQAITV